MTLRSEYTDMIMSCPFTGKMINTTLINPNMYPHWISKGFGYMFVDEDRKSELELDMDYMDEEDFLPKKPTKK